MKPKPQKTETLNIIAADEERRVIEFWATRSIIEEIKSYGEIRGATQSDRYETFYLYVTHGYNFKEVLDYLKGLADGRPSI